MLDTKGDVWELVGAEKCSNCGFFLYQWKSNWKPDKGTDQRLGKYKCDCGYIYYEYPK